MSRSKNYQLPAAALAFALAGASTVSAAPVNPTPSDNAGNTAGGTLALFKLTNGAANTAFGLNALARNTTAFSNTAVGANALLFNTTGSTNAAFGASALLNNTTGFDNTASGAFALFRNTTGEENTAHGKSALEANTIGPFNTAIGSLALAENTVGAFNTAVGRRALSKSINGNENVAIGNRALANSISGNRNIALGSGAGTNLKDGFNDIYIGNTGANESDTIRVGSVQQKTFIAGIRGRATGLADAVTVVIDSKGQLGTVNSSARFKEDVHDMADYSRRLYDLRPVTYRYKEPVADGTKPVEPGLIAEEVEKVYPDLVAYGADGQVETVQYHKLTPMLLNEVQNLNRTVEVQQEKIAQLEARLADQVARVAEHLVKLELSSEERPTVAAYRSR